MKLILLLPIIIIQIKSKLSTDLDRLIGCDGDLIIGVCLRLNLARLSFNSVNGGRSSGCRLQQSQTKSLTTQKEIVINNATHIIHCYTLSFLGISDILNSCFIPLPTMNTTVSYSYANPSLSLVNGNFLVIIS